MRDDRPGNATQSRGLAEALGWPFEIKTLHCGWLSGLQNRLLGASLLGIDRSRSSALDPPWPDLVIASGRRMAPVAQWIRKRSGGRTRIVTLGRKAGDAADLVDLAITPEYCRCAPHPNRFVTRGPLHAMTRAALEAAREEWYDILCPGSSAPRIAVLVGGRSGQYRVDAQLARRFGSELERFASEAQASLWVSTSRRTGDAATRALAESIGKVARFDSWSADGGANPYRGILACADAFVITGDSESMLAEACFTGKPVYIYSLPWRWSFHFLRFFRERVLRAAEGGPTSPPASRPESRLGRLCAWLIGRGFVRPSRDLDLLRDSLVERGVARPFGAAYEHWESPPFSEVEAAAQRVRELMAGPR